jgi:hypothetical protein
MPLVPGVRPTTNAASKPAVHSSDLGSAFAALRVSNFLAVQELHGRRGGLIGCHDGDPTHVVGVFLDMGPQLGHSQAPFGPCWAWAPQFGQFTATNPLLSPARAYMASACPR